MDNIPLFIQGKTYNRRELHQSFGGQQQGGISTPSDRNIIMLFVGEQGHEYGYRDEWTDEGTFLLTGEGQRGEMSFVRGNAAIRDHAANGKDLHLFEYVHPGFVRYVGQMVYVGFQYHTAPDVDGKDRQVIVFELAPIEEFRGEVASEIQETERVLWPQTLDSLREKAIAAAGLPTTSKERKANVIQRSAAIRVYVLKRANGMCEACGSNAPFVTATGRLFLEPHHIRRLSDGGPDDPNWVIGVCPNCHRRAHYSKDRVEFNAHLTEIVTNKENPKPDS